MRVVSSQAELSALEPKYQGEIVALGDGLFTATGLIAGAWTSISRASSATNVQALIDAAAVSYLKLADLVTTVDVNSTNLKFPSAKAVWDLYASLFPPFPSTGLTGHYKADGLVLSNNDPVASWTDESGGGNHLLQATGSQKPLFKTNVINGLPVVRFDGVNDFLSANLAALDTRNMTVLIVRNTSATSGIISIAVPNTSVDEELLMYDSGTLGVLHQSSNGNYTNRAHQTPSPSGFFIETGRWGTSQNSLDMWINGVLGTPSIGGSGSPGNYISASRTMYLARRNETPTARFAGMDVAELLVYNSVISDADRQAAEAYLAAKYAISI